MKLSLRVWLAVTAAFALLLPACGGGSSSPSPGPTATPTPTGTQTASPTSFTCPASDGTSSIAFRGGAEGQTRHMPQRARGTTYAPGLIAVTYDRGAYQRSSTAYMRSEQSVGGTATQTFDFQYINKVVRVLSVPPSQMQRAMATLRAQSGVLSVSETGQRRYAMTVQTPYGTLGYPWPNDGYFNGFQVTVKPTASATTPPATYHGPAGQTPPYDELDSVPGQWDMHAIKMEYVWGYGNALMNTAGSSALANFTSSTPVKLAVIDTGEDTLHAELSGNVTYQACFITNTSNVQSTSNFSTDPDGHGTNVAGIAAGVTNNTVGFGSAAGNTAHIMAYRVFPTPDDNCGNPTSTDPACGSDTRDIAAAINDAVNHGAFVISMSIGGGGCSAGGVDTDPVEGAAVSNAIAKGVVVVAASGNEFATSVDAPGCDSGVIAVGASALADGGGNGSTKSGGTIDMPIEYVASYSNVGSPAASAKSASAWGIVAPGGDPSSNTDADDLHWIENIWTSTPFMANSSDTTFAGTCTGDYPTDAGTTDCRTLIAGTSQATPHVAGVAALICAISGNTFCTPSRMKSLLCTTADDISDPHEGCGRLNAYRAVATALNDPSIPP